MDRIESIDDKISLIQKVRLMNRKEYELIYDYSSIIMYLWIKTKDNYPNKLRKPFPTQIMMIKEYINALVDTIGNGRFAQYVQMIGFII